MSSRIEILVLRDRILYIKSVLYSLVHLKQTHCITTLLTEENRIVSILSSIPLLMTVHCSAAEISYPTQRKWFQTTLNIRALALLETLELRSGAVTSGLRLLLKMHSLGVHELGAN